MYRLTTLFTVEAVTYATRREIIVSFLEEKVFSGTFPPYQETLGPFHCSTSYVHSSSVHTFWERVFLLYVQHSCYLLSQRIARLLFFTSFFYLEEENKLLELPTQGSTSFYSKNPGNYFLASCGVCIKVKDLFYERAFMVCALNMSLSPWFFCPVWVSLWIQAWFLYTPPPFLLFLPVSFIQLLVW